MQETDTPLGAPCAMRRIYQLVCTRQVLRSFASPSTAFILPPAVPADLAAIITQRYQLRCTQLMQHKFRLVTPARRFLPSTFSHQYFDNQIKTRSQTTAYRCRTPDPSGNTFSGHDNARRQNDGTTFSFSDTWPREELFSQQAVFGVRSPVVCPHFSDFSVI